MKPFSFAIALVLFATAFACKQSVGPTPEATTAPSFNEVNVTFANDQIQCLLSQWYKGTYKGASVAFQVVNDSASYAALFPCSLTSTLPAIDFNRQSLLIGMKADYANFINSPVNITAMNQQLVALQDGTYTLQVQVVGQAPKDGKGSEWFAFASVVPKLTEPVKLDMQYQFQ